MTRLSTFFAAAAHTILPLAAHAQDVDAVPVPQQCPVDATIYDGSTACRISPNWNKVQISKAQVAHWNEVSGPVIAKSCFAEAAHLQLGDFKVGDDAWIVWTTRRGLIPTLTDQNGNPHPTTVCQN